MDEVILVDEADRAGGRMEKIAAHVPPGVLHRAFSVFLFSPDGRWLLQQRAAGKYHFPLVWTNACCSHPAPGEGTREAAARRLREELGIDPPPLEEKFSFVYRAESAATGLCEHEFDHVFFGICDALPPSPDPEEVASVRFWEKDEIARGLAETPERFSPWFRIVFERIGRETK